MNNSDNLNNNLYDTHAHLDMLLKNEGFWPKLREDDEQLIEISQTINPNYFEDLGLNYSPEVNIYLEEKLTKHSWVIQPTVSTFNFLQSQNLILNSKIFMLLGSHPEIVQPNFKLKNYLDFQETAVQYIQARPNLQAKLVGVGECGLDYFYSQDVEIIATQKALFRSQIQLAIKLNLPLIIHCRNAFSDLFEILSEYPAIHNNFLIHCFTGTIDEAKSVVKLGGKMAVGGILTFNSAKQLQEAVSGLDLEHFMLETDLPFLAPNPFRGKTCVPEMIELSMQKLAELKDESVENVLENTKLNAQKFFKI